VKVFAQQPFQGWVDVQQGIMKSVDQAGGLGGKVSVIPG